MDFGGFTHEVEFFLKSDICLVICCETATTSTHISINLLYYLLWIYLLLLSLRDENHLRVLERRHRAFFVRPVFLMHWIDLRAQLVRYTKLSHLLVIRCQIHAGMEP